MSDFSLSSGEKSIISLDLSNAIGVKGKAHKVGILLTYFSDELVPKDELESVLPGFIRCTYSAELNENDCIEERNVEENNIIETNSTNEVTTRLYNSSSDKLFDYFLNPDDIHYELAAETGRYLYMIFSEEKLIYSGLVDMKKSGKVVGDISSLVRNEKYVWIISFSMDDRDVCCSGIYCIE